jgi:CHAT domain-containing protein
LGLGISEQREGFSPLPGAERELKDIVRIPKAKTGIFAGTIRLNANFKKDETISLWRDGKYPVIHIASHYSFNPVDQTASFLLVGDGKITFEDLQDKDNLFGAVDLLTLSACDTALTGNGKETEGFPYLAQSLGAKAVLASLWKVSDSATPELMIRFYKLRAVNPLMPKDEAFRYAQLTLLNGNGMQKKSFHSARRSEVLKANSRKDDLKPFIKDAARPFAHPHYWASFVLIGNWR